MNTGRHSDRAIPLYREVLETGERVSEATAEDRILVSPSDFFQNIGSRNQVLKQWIVVKDPQRAGMKPQ